MNRRATRGSHLTNRYDGLKPRTLGETSQPEEVILAISLSIPAATELKPRIVVFGVGGAGGNAVNNMIHSQLSGVEFVVANTDAQALTQSATETRLQLGIAMTQGLGAGSRPDVGRAAAEEAIEDILQQLGGSHMCFITAGMGGGTGTGAAPVVARAAREEGILTVGVVTKPFQFEGAHRMAIAERGIDELQQTVDTLIVIPNQNLFRVANEKTTFADAFKMADEVLHMGVRGVTDLMVSPGLINLDFADVRTVMSEMGKAMMGTGESAGEDRAVQAAEQAISNPLLDDISLKGAKGVLINITGGMDLTLFEVDEAANKIRGEVDPEANIIVGSTFDDALDGAMRVSVVATGIDADEVVRDRPVAVNTPYLRSVPMPAAEAPAVAEAEERPAGDVVDQPAVEQPAAAEPDVAEVAVAEPVAAVAAAVPEPAESVAEAPPTQSEAVFVAPPPVRPEVRRPPLRARDPFREAGLATTMPEPAERTGRKEPSLFERITGTGRARPQDAVAPVPGGASPVAAASSAVAPAVAEAAMSEEPSSAKANPEPVERLVKPGEDHNLDIPAFLRRQAN